MKPPDTIIVPCPQCHIPLVIPVRYEYPNRRTIDVVIDRDWIRAHAEACAQRQGGGDGDVGSD